MGWRSSITAALVALIVLAAPRLARAGSAALDNGLTAGSLQMGVDDYGSFGRGLHPALYDVYTPIDAPGQNYAPNFMAGIILSLTNPSNQQTVVALSGDSFYLGYVDPARVGIMGALPLARTITTPISSISSMEARSAFSVTYPGAPAGQAIQLDFTLDQVLTVEPSDQSTRLEQTYTMTNNGAVALSLVFDVQTDPDLPWTYPTGQSQSNYPNDDVVGVGQGLCYVYQHEPGSSTESVALGDGASSVPITHYFGSKQGVDPFMTPAPADKSTIYAQFGIPLAWQNQIANVGMNMVGESGPMPYSNAMIGTEYVFTIGVGETKTIAARRYWGTTTLPCTKVPVTCGNGTVDAGEQCDSSGVDTAACNGATCTTPACGDGYVNMAAGEQCESNGIDSQECDGATCTTPRCGDGHVNTAAGEQCDSSGSDTASCDGATCTLPVCGDGYVNAAAGEECESGPLCDTATCTAKFRVGGGCAGCATDEPPGGALVLAGAGLLLGRRRRRAARSRIHRPA